MFPFGWKKDKRDERDFLFRPLVKLEEVPDFFVIEELPSVRDQGRIGSCTGFGIGGALTSIAKQTKVYTEWFSPTWIYNGGRLLNNELPWDVGAYPRLCMEFIRKYGCLLEHFRPYKDTLDTTNPLTWGVNDEAAKYPIVAYYRVVDGVNGLIQALASGKVVAIGNPWFDSWMNPPSSGLLAEDYRLVVGGHMTFLYGYDLNKKVFFGQNSWGNSWGNNGRYQMPFTAIEAFKTFGGYDAYIVDVTWQPKPEPPEPDDDEDNGTPVRWLAIVLVLAALGLIGGFIFLVLKFFGVL